MANSLDVKIIEDGCRNAVVKIVGFLDSSDWSQADAIKISSFIGNDQPPSVLVGLKLVEADYTVSSGLVVMLGWNGNTIQPMVNCSESGELQGRRHGGFPPNRTVSGYDGDIALNTKGFKPGSVYGFTIGLRMVKMYS